VFVHIGGDVVVRTSEIICINDLETTSSAITKEFLDIAKEEGFIEDISSGDTKSFIIVNQDNQQKIYFSPISSLTIKKRANFLKNLTDYSSC